MEAINNVNKRGRVRKLQIGHRAKESKKKETTPSRVTYGKAEIQNDSHFSSNLLTFHTNILV